MKKTQKIKNVILFVLYALILGAGAGAVVWLVLKAMSMGISLIWDTLPEMTGHSTIYTVAVCLIGGLLIGLFQKKYGLLPDTLEEVMKRLKRDGTYPYDRLHILIIAALMPLLFGGALGPEAGLTGVIVGLFCWAGDGLKYKGEQARELAEAGMAATLSVIFNAPLFGFINNYEHPREVQKKYFSPAEFKFAKTVVYTAGVVGGFGTMILLKHLFGGALGLGRFPGGSWPAIDDWKWTAVFVVVGIASGLFFILCNKLSRALAKPLENKRIISCIIGGAFLALIGVLLPWTMFSGEEEISKLMGAWQGMGSAYLILTGAVKLLLINLCINFGWRGGNIFPIIFSGVAIGYGLASLTGVMPEFAVALTVAAICGYIMRRPLAVAGILLLCFPLSLILPIIGAAYIGSLIPIPTRRKSDETV